jgi:hypothetical protein
MDGDKPADDSTHKAVLAMCPDCRTADTVSHVDVTDVRQFVYHSCARCKLVWGTDLAGRRT